MVGRPTLSRALVAVPEHPERAIQFGTGGFLRGFVELFLDEANRAGCFDGRVVLVGSTGSGRDARLNAQDCLYTLVSQGIVDGVPRREHQVIGSVSRALVAATEWDAVLRVAEDPAVDLIFSNSTEVGIVFDESDAAGGEKLSPPRSFPAKLARFLLHRARHFAFDPARAPVVVPCELIERNGERLREIVAALADRWAVDAAFRPWLAAVIFCDTLVDRIVPGAPDDAQREELQTLLGYDDAMITMCEPYRLFAIQGDDALARRLRFPAADPGVIVTGDVTPYRERKVRLLNGGHTALVSLALLAGCTTVREAVTQPALGAFLRSVLFDEIVPSLDVPGAEPFAREVLDRFANPYVQHALWDITLHSTTKLKVRVVPTILEHGRRTGHAPRALALGFAAWLVLQRGELQAERRSAGLAVPSDAAGESVRDRWSRTGDDPAAITALVRDVCRDRTLWDADLDAVPGFAELVTDAVTRIRHDGALAAVNAVLGVPA